MKSITIAILVAILSTLLSVFIVVSTLTELSERPPEALWPL
jgi:hypothetical protein